MTNLSPVLFQAPGASTANELSAPSQDEGMLDFLGELREALVLQLAADEAGRQSLEKDETAQDVTPSDALVLQILPDALLATWPAPANIAVNAPPSEGSGSEVISSKATVAVPERSVVPSLEPSSVSVPNDLAAQAAPGVSESLTASLEDSAIAPAAQAVTPKSERASGAQDPREAVVKLEELAKPATVHGPRPVQAIEGDVEAKASADAKPVSPSLGAEKWGMAQPATAVVRTETVFTGSFKTAASPNQATASQPVEVAQASTEVGDKANPRAEPASLNQVQNGVSSSIESAPVKGPEIQASQPVAVDPTMQATADRPTSRAQSAQTSASQLPDRSTGVPSDTDLTDSLEPTVDVAGESPVTTVRLPAQPVHATPKPLSANQNGSSQLASDPVIQSARDHTDGTPSPSRSVSQASQELAVTEIVSEPAAEERMAANLPESREAQTSFTSTLLGPIQGHLSQRHQHEIFVPTRSPAPLEPHLVQLDGGEVKVEIMRLAQQGGGQVVMELTPPDQSKFRIDLKIDHQGVASLVVEGASDSTRSRLEQGAEALQQQFSEMGLSLQLDMRQSQDARTQREAEQQWQASTDTGSWPLREAPQTSTDAQRARALTDSQVHLYA